MLDSLSKVYLCVTRDGSKLDVLLQGQPVINTLLRATQEPTQVTLNGEPVEPPYYKENQAIWLSLEKN